MYKYFIKLYHFFNKKPFLLLVFVFIIVFCAIIAINKIHFVEDISDFFPNDKNNKQTNLAFKKITNSNQLIINIKEAEKDTLSNIVDIDMLQNAVDHLVDNLKTVDTASRIEKIIYEVEEEKIRALTNFIIENLPYFINDSDYQRFDTLITEANISKQLAINKQLLASPMGIFKNIILNDPLFLSSKILKSLENFKPDNNYKVVDNYLFNKKGDEAIIIINSKYPLSETHQNEILINDIEKAINITEQQLNNKVDIECFGAAMVSITNSKQIKTDSLMAVLLSITLIIALLIYYFRNIKNILLIIASIIFGLCFTLACILIFKSTISIISIGVASMIIGIAINYPIHFLVHSKYESNPEQLIKNIVNPLIIGNITTVGAFLSLTFISSNAMKDIGILVSLLLIGTILFVLFVLPHCVKNNSTNFANKELNVFRFINNFEIEKNKIIVIVIVLITCVLFYFSLHSSFDTNMMSINYMTDAQKESFKKIMPQDSTKQQTIYCIAEASNMDSALLIYEMNINIIDSLCVEDKMIKVSGIGAFLPSKTMQQLKIDKWNKYWNKNKDNFVQIFDSIANVVGYKANSFHKFHDILNKKYEINDIEYFNPIRESLANNYIVETDDNALVYTILKVDVDRLNIIENAINNKDNNFYTFTNLSIAERLISSLSKDFDYVLYICAIIVFSFLLFSFGRIELSLISFIPLTLAWVWILGIMYLLDIKFNIVNIILATFIFGQGDDYTILVTEGLLHEHCYGKKILNKFKSSIFLSAMIMFIGIGMLIFAKHPAMRSLAEVTIIGMISVLIMTYTIPPFLFNWITTKNGKRRTNVITLWAIFKTVLSSIVFFIGSFLLSMFTFVLCLFGFKKTKVKYLFHILICYIFKFLAKILIQIKYKIININNEDFSTPAIIIANHQSHLDLLFTLMLHPKIIVITNEWVRNTPIYGKIVNFADFVYISDNYEDSLKRLNHLISDGYSILVFPEGTRSENCSILRFHKGAFKLAEELKLDILPIVLHGVGFVLPKNDFLLKKSNVTIKILPRIKVNDEKYRKDKTMAEMAKMFRKMYIDEYEKLVIENETPKYFRDLVYNNYIYKGKEIAQNARKVLKLNNNFEEQIASLPNDGEVYINNCGQGEYTLLAALVKKNLIIKASDPDIEKLSIARNCALKPDNLVYVDYQTC